MINYLEIIDRLIKEDRDNPRRIMVIGDAMLDLYVQGRLDKCQDDCPKFVAEDSTMVHGGAANAARSLSNWNCQVKQLMSPNLGPLKTRLMVGDKCVFRMDDDRSTINIALTHAHIIRTLCTWRPHAVLISDYDKGLLTPDFLRNIIHLCNSQDIPCVADAKREPELYEGAIIKGNTAYFAKEGYPQKARKMDTQCVTTHTAYLPLTWDKGNVSCPMSQNMTDINCVNHVGAGDCFAAHLALSLGCGLSLKEATAVAHSAGRVYVQRRYNEPPTVDRIREDMSTW